MPWQRRLNKRLYLTFCTRGKSMMAIHELTGTTWSTISWVKQHQSTERRQAETSKPVRTPRSLAQVRQAIKSNPRTTIAAHSRHFGIPEPMMRRLVNDDLECRSYKRPRAHKIMPGAKKCCLEWAQRILNKLKHNHAGKTIIFTDKKYFTLAQYSNCQNDKLIWCKGDRDNALDSLSHVAQAQHPAGVMFFGTVTSNGKVASPIFVEKGIKINADAYVDILWHKIRPWVKANFVLGMFVWQQDGASAHTARTAQDYLHQLSWEFWEKVDWPPNSPDCALLDYSI